MKSETEMLGLQIEKIKDAYRLSFRDIESETGIPNATIWRVIHGKEVSYETGKRLEKWAMNFKAPKTLVKDGITYIEQVKRKNA